MVQVICHKLLSVAEYLFVYISGKIFGITLVVRYLRNPNPHITSRLLRSFGASIGKNTTIKRSVYIDNAYEDKNSAGDFRYLVIGRNCYIGDSSFFDLSNKIVIGDNVIISGKASFVTHSDCNRSEYLNERFPRVCLPSTINNGAWIGFNATLLPGVTVGRNAIIAAGSLVRNDVEQFTLYAGVPAIKIKEINEK